MEQRKTSLRLENHAECEILSSLISPSLVSSKFSGKTRYYARQAFLWLASDHHEQIFFLKAGRVHVSSADAAGHETLIQVVAKGDLFGEFCFCAFRHEPVGTFACAVAPSEVIGISFPEFQQLLMRDKILLTKLMEMFCTRLVEAEQRVQILGLHDARHRIGRLLLHLAAMRGRTAERPAGQVSLTISHAELAARASLSRPHVSLLMARLRREGLLSYRRSGPLTLDTVRLKKNIDASEA